MLRAVLLVCVSLTAMCNGNFDVSKVIDDLKCQGGRHFLTSTNVTCINFNFEILTCKWCKFNISHDESLQMYYSTEPNSVINTQQTNNHVSWKPCLNETSHTCSWTVINYPAKVYVKVVLSNIRLKIITDTSVAEFSSNDIVKPAPVQNFTVYMRQNNCITWHWHFGQSAMDYTCALAITSNCTDKQTKTVLYSAKTGVYSSPGMCRLNPHTEYSLRVKCKFMVNSSVIGYWSDEVSLSKQLNPDVPYKSPPTVEGLYDIKHLPENGNISVTVYFTPLNRCELHDSPEDVVYIFKWHGMTVNVSHPNFYAVINIQDDKIVKATIQAANSVGLSTKISDLTIFPPKLEARSNSQLSVETNNTSDYCSTTAIVTRFETEALMNYDYLSHTIVWCESMQTLCKKPIDWLTVESKKVDKLPIKHCKNRFRFGLITHGCDTSRSQCVFTGIHWLDSKPQTQLDDLKKGHVVEWMLPLACFLVIVITIGLIIFCIRRKRGYSQLPSSVQSTTDVTEIAFGSSQTVTSERTETEQLFKERKRKENKKYRDQISWTKCMKQPNKCMAETLLSAKILPTDVELKRIYSQFGKRSKLLKNVCAQICELIKEIEQNITNIWPAYRPSADKIVFLVESDVILSNIPDIDFEIVQLGCTNDLSEEGDKVLTREMEIDYGKYDIEKLKQLKQCVSNNAKWLMDKHQNINVISPCAVKSVNFNSCKQHELIDTLCISIYIDKKVRDIILLDEDEIPADIDGFPTDVIEGRFNVFNDGPNDYQKYLKIGCGIHASVTDDKGNILGGTLGGFLEHDKFGTCCITSAHVVLPLADLEKAKENGYLEYTMKTGKRVYQPAGCDGKEFGIVMAVAYKEGIAGMPGVEVALIKILKRHPVTGSFPRGSGDTEKSETFVFNSGNICKDYLRPMTNVFKYGMGTGPTIGNIGLDGSVVRRHKHLDDQKFGVRLCEQIVIFPVPGSRFADFGDSGACVLIDYDKAGREAAIGVVEGGLENGKVFASPIYDALLALKCKPLMTRFESSFDSGVNCQGAIGNDSEEDMDWS